MLHRAPQFRITTLLLAVLVMALGLAGYIRYRQSRTAWEVTGGMIGWKQGAIESRLGSPFLVVEGDVADSNARQLRVRPPGKCRTLVFRNLDGEFIVRLIAEGDDYVCFGSYWTEKQRYY
jgi:hypothetical protein